MNLLRTAIITTAMIFTKGQAQEKEFNFLMVTYRDASKDRLEKDHPIIEKAFRDSGLNLKINSQTAGIIVPSDKLSWDFSMSNTIVVIMQRQSGNNVIPVFWNKKCSFDTVALIPKDSTLTLENLKDKKIGIFNFGYISVSSLAALKFWKLDGATLLSEKDGPKLVEDLMNKKVDVILTNANVFGADQPTIDTQLIGSKFDLYNVKILKTFHTNVPCRMVSANGELDKKTIEKSNVCQL